MAKKSKPDPGNFLYCERKPLFRVSLAMCRRCGKHDDCQAREDYEMAVMMAREAASDQVDKHGSVI